MDKRVTKVISAMYGNKCCRISVGDNKSLSLGFGQKIFHNNDRLKDIYYGEWEIGSYYGAWRVIRNRQIILGSMDYENDNCSLEDIIKSIDFGEIVKIMNFSIHDVRVEFNSGIFVDFVPIFSNEDELFHIFCPMNIYVELDSKGVWKIGKSNIPWTDSKQVDGKGI